MLYDKKMSSLKDKILEQSEKEAEVVEPAKENKLKKEKVKKYGKTKK
jgi:hypothetical protein